MPGITLNVDTETLDSFTDNPEVPEMELTNTKLKEDVDETTSSDPQVVCKITSAAYGGFTKILSLISANIGKADIISIKDGKLSTVSGSGYLDCDLSVLFGDSSIELTDPTYSIKMMKLITGGNEVTIIDDDENSRYLVSNLDDNGDPITNITLPKPQASMTPKISKPELGEIKEKLDIMSPDLVAEILNAEKTTESQYFILELCENKDNTVEIVSISTDKESVKRNFKQIPKDNQDNIVKYKLFNPFPIIKPDEVTFELYKSDSSDYWVKTSSEIGVACIDYMEKLNAIGVFNSFSFD